MLLLHECILKKLLLIRCLNRLLPFLVGGRGATSPCTELTRWLVPAIERIPIIVVLFTLIQTLSTSSDKHLVSDVSIGPSHPLRIISPVNLSKILDIRVEIAQIIIAAESLECVA
jgi:hypothetical protein